MNKFITKLAKLFFGISMAAGVGVAVGTRSKAESVRAAEVTDTLNRALTGITKNTTTYSSWSDKSDQSSAVYAGNSAGGNDSIQLRSNNSNSGVVSTSSGGKVKSVTIVWNSNTADDRTVNVYGKNTAYSAASDLYNANNQGTLLGTIVFGTSTNLTVTGDYEYVGFRSASGALYCTSVSIVWETGGTSLTDVTTETSLSATGNSLDLADENSSITLTASVTANVSVPNPTVTFSASEKGIVNITTESGALETTITPLSVGTTSITAKFFEKTDSDYKYKESSSSAITITVLDTSAPSYEWVLTELSNLTTSDVFVIVGNNSNNYAMTNDNGTDGPPSTSAVTVENGKISSNVSNNIQWNISGNGTDGYTFYPNGNSEAWLYCTAANNGVRVGTNTNKTFTIEDGYLKNSGTSRYVGIYNSQDWRCYTSKSTNINDQTFSYFKRKVVTTEPYVEFTNTAKTTVMLKKDGSEVSISGLSASVLNIANPTYYWELEDVSAGCNAAISGTGSTPSLTVSSISGNQAQFTVKVGAKANNTGDTVYSETTVTFTVKPFGGSISWTPRTNMEYREGYGVVYSTLTFTTTMNDGSVINYGGDYSSLKMMYGTSASDLSELTGSSNITSADDLNGKYCKIIDENNNASSIAGTVSSVVFTPKATLALSSVGNITNIGTNQTIYLKSTVGSGWGDTLTYSTESDLITLNTSTGVITSKTTTGSNIVVTASLSNGTSENFVMSISSPRVYSVTEANDMGTNFTTSNNVAYGGGQTYTVTGQYLYKNGQHLLVDDASSPTVQIYLYSFTSFTNNSGTAISSFVNGATITVTAKIYKYASSTNNTTVDIEQGTVDSYEAPQPTSFSITGGSEVLVGSDLPLSLSNILPSGASDSVTWGVSPSSGATVTQSGVFNATTHGVYRVTATSTGSNHVSSYIDISAYEYHRTELVLKNNPKTEYYQGENVENDLVSAVVYYQCGENTSYKSENISSEHVAPTYSYNGSTISGRALNTINTTGASLGIESAIVEIATINDSVNVTPSSPLSVSNVKVVAAKPVSLTQTTAPAYTDSQTFAQGNGRWTAVYQNTDFNVENIKIGDENTTLKIGGNTITTTEYAKDYDGQIATIEYTDENVTVSANFTISVATELSVDSFEGVPEYLLTTSGEKHSAVISVNYTSLLGTASNSPVVSAVSSNTNKLTVSSVDNLFDESEDSGLASFTITAGSVTGQANITVYVSLNGRTESKSFGVTIRATEPSQATGEGSYVKITSTADLTNGTYLVVCENSNVAFDGSLDTLDATSNGVAVTIDNGTISQTAALDAVTFTINTSDGSLRSHSGYYIGATSNANSLNTSETTEYTNTISFDEDGNATIISSGGAYLRYNSNSDQARFRYYKSGSYTGQKAIQLYKFVAGAAVSESGFDLVNDFVNEFMHMNDVSINNTSDTGACRGSTGYYLTAKAGWNSMATSYEGDDNLLNIFENSFEDAYARYMAWATAVGDSQPFVGTTIQNSKLSLLMINDVNKNTVAIIAIISMVSMTAIGGYFFLRKRKEQ